MKDYAKGFYLSKQWRAVREYVYKRDYMICTNCGKPGEIVHHIEHISKSNIDNPYITLNIDNLVTLCRACHALEHPEGSPPIEQGLYFDEQGNVLERKQDEYNLNNLYNEQCT